ncbi:Mitochondrial phosphate carrier protein 2, mitochondrial [Dendrobium catenatum]|uniref:Mitochondrial phosphate carrier protein 2, mitochondrial n=1 Tax=Dendrobium catenatum TaxID=906689 RepID=A0A2I0VNV2_9ASPA|nr:Mitochondrial phosphate carrier protein 2, mitochondrial [Dendrobium catenatum]
MTSYKSSGFGVVLKEQVVKGFFKGWAPTLLGYSRKRAFKYCFYEFFKKYYYNIIGPEYVVKYNTLIYLFIADIAICLMEAMKVCFQTQQAFARGLSDGLSKIVKYKGNLRYIFKDMKFKLKCDPMH